MSTAEPQPVPYPGPTRPMLGARLRTAAEAVHAAGYARLVAAGFDELRPAHFALVKFPGPHGVRPTELAAHVGGCASRRSTRCSTTWRAGAT